MPGHKKDYYKCHGTKTLNIEVRAHMNVESVREQTHGKHLEGQRKGQTEALDLGEKKTLP